MLSWRKKELFKVVICGCRDFYNYDFLKEKCLYYLQNKMPNVLVISGAASGVDTLGEQFANEFGLKIERHPADWNRYGKRAGPIRNEEMVKICDGVIAFWDGQSRGTKTTIDFCKQYNKRCIIVKI